jgi:hypothetical protein
MTSDVALAHGNGGAPSNRCAVILGGAHTV